MPVQHGAIDALIACGASFSTVPGRQTAPQQLPVVTSPSSQREGFDRGA